jgi:hypothetical protein
MMMIQDTDVARLLADDKAFGRAIARLIAYVRLNAVPMTLQEAVQ